MLASPAISAVFEPEALFFRPLGTGSVSYTHLMLIQHHDLDDLETDILDLNNLLKEKEFKEYKRTCEAGIIELDHIYNSEIPSVGNVF